MTSDLLPIGQIIKYSRRSGVTFGHGDPRVHLAYLTKLRLLPQSIRRKIGDKIEGCYPEWVIPTLKKIEELKDRGLTYSQIKFQIKNDEIKDLSYGIKEKNWEMGNASGITQNSQFPQPASFLSSQFSYPLSNSHALPFLIVGLLLGYLFATNNNVTKPVAGSLQLASGNQQLATNTISPLDEKSQSLVRIVTNQESTENQPLYLIAVPQKNLYRLGSVSINDLTKTK